MELQGSFVENPIHGIGLLHLLQSQCCSGDLEAAILEDLFPSEYRMWVREWKLHVYDVP